MSKFIDLTGQRFGKLTVVKEAFRDKGVHWICMCDCGNQATVLGTSLRTGHTTSCSCGRFDGALKTAKKLLSNDPRTTSARNVFNGYKDGNLTFEQFVYLTQTPCYYCGNLPENSNVYNRYRHRKSTVLTDIPSGDFYYNGLDRIDNSRSHDLDNVVPCCKWCNSAKMGRSLTEFEAWLERAYQMTQKRKGS